MVSRNLLRQLDAVSGSIEADLQEVFGATENWLPLEGDSHADGVVVSGRVRKVSDDSVWVDIGYKSEGVIELREWYDDASGHIIAPNVGESLDVLIETIEDGNGAVVLSHRKAKRQKAWEQVLSTKNEGDIVSGPVTRKIKGGLLVDIGLNVFLPASQVDVRRVPDVGDFIGKIVDCKIISIDREKRNIVVSRRRLIEDQRAELKTKVMETIEVGQILPGVVKNIASFGAFVDIGGIDGLLHVTDMAWHRVDRPEDIVRVDDKINVCVLKVDKKTDKISLGLKQTTPSPWVGAVERYAIGSRHTGEVVNVMAYGAFVKLEPGVEGLVHISEMSWTKRINHPKEFVNSGDSIEVEILSVNPQKQEISLGIKQTQANPWDAVVEKYPTGAIVEGTVRHLTNYGAFIEVEEGVDGLLHLSDMAWDRKVAQPKDVVREGEKIRCVVLEVDTARRRIGLGLKQLKADPWSTDVSARYGVNELKMGRITKITNFGYFVELEPGLEGLLHVSELGNEAAATSATEGASAELSEGQTIEVRVLAVDVEKRKIGLSCKTADNGAGAVETPGQKSPTLRGGMGSGGNLLGDLGSNKEQ